MSIGCIGIASHVSYQPMRTTGMHGVSKVVANEPEIQLVRDVSPEGRLLALEDRYAHFFVEALARYQQYTISGMKDPADHWALMICTYVEKAGDLFAEHEGYPRSTVAPLLAGAVGRYESAIRTCEKYLMGRELKATREARITRLQAKIKGVNDELASLARIGG